MKIHFMKDEALAYFKGNAEYNVENYLEKSNLWMTEKYTNYKENIESPFAEFKSEVPDFQMDMSSEKPESTDYNNVKILHTALKNISDTQASDERFWVGLAHNELWEYMIYRCKLDIQSIDKNKILTNFFFKYGNKRSLIVHPLARMWWVGRLIFDDKSKDPYHSLEYMRSDFSTKVLSLFSSNFTNNPVVARSILNAITDIKLQSSKFGRSDFLELIRYVNLLGGLIILDYLSEEELKEKIINHYFEINNLVPEHSKSEMNTKVLYSLKNENIMFNESEDDTVMEEVFA